ncbi:MAG TPA: ester cyclase [Vicinamibacterales bacterium]|nr:ester cyclase [Vicinamibacterales bacterium]
MSIENKTLVQRWFSEVWNEGRADAIDEMLADDAVIHGLGANLQGPAEFKRFHSGYRNAYPDVTIDVDDLVAEGDMVAVRWSARGTHRGDGLGFPATGKRAQFTGMVFVRIKAGKLVEGWNNFDQLGMLQQLGIVSLPSAV